MSVICTLYEGNYHCGVAALVNSLYFHGFRGTFVAGYRGALPPWAGNAVRNGHGSVLDAAPDCRVRFVPVDTTIHLNNYKTQFLSWLLEEYPQEEKFFYFDPDIVVKNRWSFFEEWVGYGTALVEDINHYQPRNHPVRQAWIHFAQAEGFQVHQVLDKYYNAGFVGFTRARGEFLRVWRALFDIVIARGADLSTMKLCAFKYPYLETDQELLNLAVMLTPDPLSVVGPEGMDFAPGGYVMSHSAGSTKSWSKRFVVEALTGRSPTRTDKEFLYHTQRPIQLFTPAQLARRQLGARIGAAIGRFYRRS